MFTRLILISLLLATACAPGSVQNTSQPQTGPVAAAKSPSEVTVIPSPGVTDELQKKLTQMAVDDLRARLSLDVQSISVLSSEPAVWPDAALGCPLEGKAYAQEAVRGYQIRLRASGKVYVYHTDRTTQVILCPEVKPAEPGLR